MSILDFNIFFFFFKVFLIDSLLSSTCHIYPIEIGYNVSRDRKNSEPHNQSALKLYNIKYTGFESI